MANDHPTLRVQPVQIAGYQVVREIGRGGMGAVYEAQRQVGGGWQRVALKLLRLEWKNDPELMSRFLGEQKILATLEHPNIARMYDAGFSADGQPYIALEYIEGLSLDAYAHRQRLAITQRIKLFLSVLEAVQYAHEKLIIHRDLKPGNVLVDSAGQPHLLDFGIAKLVGERQVGSLTQPGQAPMTPAYASPEQLFGHELAVTSDVYALGVMLFELLSGELPYRSKSTSPIDIASELRGAGLRRLRSVGSGKHAAVDLEAITDKAMRVNPAHRYPNVAALAADLRAYLEHRPVHARRGAAWYRLRKWLRRHVAVLAVVTVAGAACALYVAERYRQWALLEEQRARAETHLAFVRNLFLQASPRRGGGVVISASDMLERGVSDLFSDPLMDTADKIQLIIEAAEIQRWLDEEQSADSNLTQALALTDDKPLLVHSRAQVLAALARLRIDEGRTAEAAELVGQVDPQAEINGSFRLAATLAELRGDLHLANGEPELAEAEYRKAVAALRGQNVPATEASALNALGAFLLQRSRLDEANEVLSESLRVRANLPDDPIGRAAVTNNLAAVQGRLGDNEQALETYQQALDALLRVYGPNHLRTAIARNNIGITARRVGRADAAVAAIGAALEVFIAERGTEALDTNRVRLNLALAEADAGRHDQARELGALAIQYVFAQLTPGSLAAAPAEENYALILAASDRHSEARPYLQRCAAAESTLKDAAVMRCQAWLANFAEAPARELKAQLEAVEQAQRQQFRAHSPDLIRTRLELAVLALDAGDRTASRRYVDLLRPVRNRPLSADLKLELELLYAVVDRASALPTMPWSASDPRRVRWQRLATTQR